MYSQMFKDEYKVEDLMNYIKENPWLRGMSIQTLFMRLLKEKKVDFNSLSQTYVRYLENEKHQEHCKTIEATTRLFQQFVPQMSEQPNVINSSLYILNKAGNLVYGDLNEKYKYDEKKGEEDFENTYGFKL